MPETSSIDDMPNFGGRKARISAGSMMVFFNQLPPQAVEDFRARMIGEDWQIFGPSGDATRFAFSSPGRLERALELLCVGLGPGELGLIRAAVVDESVPEQEMLFSAAQSMEYLGELLLRVRASWLHALLKQPQKFFNVFQPLIDIPTGRVFAYEMLIRAHADSRGGVIGGGQLAEAALASKQIYAFDLLAREVAIRTAADRFSQKTNVFINFMPNSLLDPERSLRKTMNDCKLAGLSPDRVVFEVVESESISDIGYLKAMLDEFRGHGFRVALDDLGSGYSGLNYMLELMPDFVKLDRELVNEAAINPAKRVVVSKLAEAAHRMNIKVVAEGVEKADDFNVLRDLGADLVQGYLFARPSPDKVYDESFDLLNHVLNGNGQPVTGA